MEKQIQKFLDTLDYELGIQLYQQLPEHNPRQLEELKRSKNNANLSFLISVLRKRKKTASPKKNKAKKNQKINKEVQEKNEDLKANSVKATFGQIKYAELPSSLKLKYRKIKDIFYWMIDLKIELNELKEDDDEKALKLMLDIYQLEQEKQFLWNEIDYFQTHGKLLEQESTSYDLNNKTPAQIFRKKESTKNALYKMRQRLKKWKSQLEEKNKHDAIKLQRQIASTEKKALAKEKYLHAINEHLDQ